jgi:hypothetical protein
MPGVGIIWPTLPGTGAAVAGVGAAGTDAGAGELAGACAAAGVSPAAAKAIAHPINLIFTPGDVVGIGKSRCALPDFGASIGAAWPTLKRLIRAAAEKC